MSSGACVVTGAGGFIGYQLANALAAEGRDVVGIDVRFPDPGGALGPPGFSRVVADFRDTRMMKQALDGAARLFHLASAHLQVGLPESEYWDVNVRSLPALLQLARAAGVSRCVHTSSVGVYGDVGSNPANEATLPQPQSLYGATKLAGERAVLEFGRAHGFEVVVLRPAWVYGPGCPRTARLCRALRQRRFLMIGAGRNLRHPVYIEDMIEACRLAAVERDAAGEVLIIAGDRAVTTHELIEAFCSAFGFPRPPARVPYAVGATAAACTEWVYGLIGREPPVSRRTLEFFSTNNVFDISHARALLGFVPRYPLMEGLAATRRWIETAA
jgi:nucleoside-diphosphate-sugar epimerase